MSSVQPRFVPISADEGTKITKSIAITMLIGALGFFGAIVSLNAFPDPRLYSYCAAAAVAGATAGGWSYLRTKRQKDEKQAWGRLAIGALVFGCSWAAISALLSSILLKDLVRFTASERDDYATVVLRVVRPGGGRGCAADMEFIDMVSKEPIRVCAHPYISHPVPGVQIRVTTTRGPLGIYFVGARQFP